MTGLLRLFVPAAALFAAAAADAQSYTHTYVERADSADHYIKNERWEEAERNLKAALRLEPANPGNALLLSNLGYVQTMLGRYDEAIGSYDISLSIAPKSAVVLSNRALAYAAAGRNEEALDDLDAALAIDSTRVMPLKMRGLLRLGKGDCAGARHDLSALVKADPKNPAAYDGLAQCEIIDGNVDKAIEMASAALGLEPSADRYCLKASLEIDASRLPEAAETLRKAIEEYPRYGDLYLLRARLHQLNYRPADMETDIRTAESNGASPELLQRLFPDRKARRRQHRQGDSVR